MLLSSSSVSSFRAMSRVAVLEPARDVSVVGCPDPSIRLGFGHARVDRQSIVREPNPREPELQGVVFLGAGIDCRDGYLRQVVVPDGHCGRRRSALQV